MAQEQRKQPTCEERIDAELRSEVETLRAMREAECKGETHPDYGPFNEHGLSFDYVSPGTFEGQKEGYFRYQISWGGPSDEFRFFTGPELKPHRIEYRFMDWFDGACRTLHGEDEALLMEIWEEFDECGVPQSEYEKAQED
jgi:hypothetical protein